MTYMLFENQEVPSQGVSYLFVHLVISTLNHPDSWSQYLHRLKQTGVQIQVQRIVKNA